MKNLITREEFTKIFNQLENHDVIYKIFEENSLIHTDSFIFVNVDGYGDVSIIESDSLDGEVKVINWYKLYHLGRALNIRGFKNVPEIINFLNRAINEIIEQFPNYVERNDNKQCNVERNVEKLVLNSCYGRLGISIDINSAYPQIIKREE